MVMVRRQVTILRMNDLYKKEICLPRPLPFENSREDRPLVHKTVPNIGRHLRPGELGRLPDPGLSKLSSTVLSWKVL